MLMLAPPPRRVPVSLQIANIFNGFAQVGWAVFGFSMIFFWVFGMNGDYSFLTFHGARATARGTVTNVESTGASENERTVMANHYEYSVAGRTFRGTSYSTGWSANTGDSVTVEYMEANPLRSRIEGMRRALFGPGVAFVVIFPLIGLGLLIPATRSGLRRNRLLREGLLTTGTLSGRRDTNMRVNKQPVWELTFDFVTRDGRRAQAKARATDTYRLEDEAREPLLYDPENPERAYVLDEVPLRPRIEAGGELRGRLGSALRSLILPAMIVAGHGMFLLLKLT
ncbi:MAG TPA: DUF3592 domain-containing protein [Thermoanaerobaculia bacterium]|nr:DUF3592 domain-containing protein [Thermoanaerobaculia bacterium]